MSYFTENTLSSKQHQALSIFSEITAILRLSLQCFQNVNVLDRWGQKQWRNALWKFPNQEPYFWTNIINSIKSFFFFEAWHNRMFLAWQTVYWKPPTENYYFPAGYFTIFTVCREMHWCILMNVQLVNKQETIRGHSRLHICTQKKKSANWCPPEFSD